MFVVKSVSKVIFSKTGSRLVVRDSMFLPGETRVEEKTNSLEGQKYDTYM